ncbi:MAG TPA: Bax inhibitor-1/YccA family protein [Chitinophagaceae bacterium]|nr:Bax inhibitor-1/YccA family protein [Chitinophagaceae bacterium]
MGMFKSGNAVISEKTFQNLTVTDPSNVMTVRGALNKTGFLFLMLIAGAVFSWYKFEKDPQSAVTLMWVGAIGGLILCLIMSFKRQTAPYLAPAYGILEGLFVGAISAYYNFIFADKMPNIIINAVGLTIGAALGMFLLYRFKIIKATAKFRAITFTATAGIAIFYVIVLVLRLFGVNVGFMHDSSPLGIGLSLFVVAIAALNLILDFDMIEYGAAHNAPKYMEWYSAFGLLVTVVWLYLEILRLLSRFTSRN